MDEYPFRCFEPICRTVGGRLIRALREGAAVITVVMHYVDIGDWLKDNTYYLLILAALIGMIPESGPHMVFISLFAGGIVPFSVLLTSSMSQDGHTSLPLLASSTRSFLVAKILNALFAVAVGSVFYLFGF